MIRPEHQFDIRPDLRKAASTKAESTTAESVIRPKQLVRVIITFPSLFPLSWLVNWLLTRVTRPVALVEQELPTLPHLVCLPPSFSGILVAYSFSHLWCFIDYFVVFLSFFVWSLCCLPFDFRFWYLFGILKLFFIDVFFNIS
jgi:hypothetical protein